jgi:DNA-binding response OmpR family regulator
MSGRLKDSRLRVLVIEDDDATRIMLAEFLAEEGFAVSSALDGAHALRAASACRPDVIVLDIGLPVLDGTGFARRWRERPESARVPIVAVSGLPYGAEMARQIGAAAYYRKPLDLQAFARVLRELADRRAVRIKPTEEIA